mgnify:CR=1 FL=1
MQRKFIAACGMMLILAGGFLVLRGGPTLMEVFGSSTLPQAAAGDPGWVGVAFMRVFGAAVLALGLITIGASRLSGVAARAIGLPLALGLGVLGLVALVQAQAIWSTPGAWLLVGLIGGAGAAVALWRPIDVSLAAR